MGTVFMFLGMCAILFLYDTLIWGLVLYKFWGWFVLPVFVTLPAITFVQAVGLMLVVGLFKSNFIGEVKKEYADQSKTWATIIILPWVTLFFGWLAYSIWLMP